MGLRLSIYVDSALSGSNEGYYLNQRIALITSKLFIIYIRIYNKKINIYVEIYREMAYIQKITRPNVIFL